MAVDEHLEQEREEKAKDHHRGCVSPQRAHIALNHGYLKYTIATTPCCQVHSSRDARAVVVHMADLTCRLRDPNNTPMHARHSLALEALQVWMKPAARYPGTRESITPICVFGDVCLAYFVVSTEEGLSTRRDTCESVGRLVLSLKPLAPRAAVRPGLERARLGSKLRRVGGARIQDDLPADVLQHGSVASRCEYTVNFT